MSSEVTTSPPNLGDLPPSMVTFTSGFRRPPGRPPHLDFPNLQDGLRPSLRTRCSRCCRIASCSQLVIHPNKSSTVLSGLRKESTSRRAVSRTYPTQLNCINSRPRTRWCQLRGLPLVGSECVCPRCNSYFVNTRGSGKPSAFRLPIYLSSAQ